MKRGPFSNQRTLICPPFLRELQVPGNKERAHWRQTTTTIHKQTLTFLQPIYWFLLEQTHRTDNDTDIDADTEMIYKYYKIMLLDAVTIYQIPEMSKF